ncbi:hypothetical protein [Paenibacillus albus]|uniref:Uncharacterized protein n=1 Tax=Paenibacillus albus TaxID=2495582 RepID=A0A3S9A5Y0_9BACL|nr:hypothetical protein [Paenibacillus albus]AZN41121.1 hypothetical protein EJC50_16660 [Paenibacillus albus]
MIDMHIGFGLTINIISSGTAALLFFAMQHKRIQRELIVTTALLTIVPMAIIFGIFSVTVIRQVLGLDS